MIIISKLAVSILPHEAKLLHGLFCL